ncbi:hypothetical protein [Pseudomonas vanderleydeniana]|uniref:Uncharacterized protein n=1 Tax=Pseudomonas vanderleydeniana TaxID=2745495 RepID=A0A9E6TS32_9PSED|nr:hypothetical protein [Pseudomonas vanderleydeniana]QXI28454.1 hypothetical protein HU752_000390 [Pseudomonas vanderleydeniana]
MKNPITSRVLLALTLSALCMPIQAAGWQVCNLELRVTESKINPAIKTVNDESVDKT